MIVAGQVTAPANVYDVAIIYASLLHGLQGLLGANTETEQVQVNDSSPL
jgi:hypothetical protein